MLAGSRNNIITGGLLFALVLLIVLLGSVYYLFSAEISLSDFSTFKSNTWWFTYKTLSSQSIHIWAIISIIAILVFILVSGIIMRILFKKTASPELFFYTIFLFSFAFESFRILNLFFHFYKIPVYLLVFNTRLVYFGRIFGILSLLCASLYAVEIKYQKFDVLVGISLLLALVMSYSLPLDSSVLLTNFLCRLGDETGVFFLNLSFALFIIINFSIAAFKRQSRFLFIMCAILVVLAGRELLFFIVNPMMIILSLVFITAGTTLFSKQIDKIYLWF